MAENDDRTEAPTQRRLDQARGEGQTPLSREFVTFGCLLGVGLFVSFRGPAMVASLASGLAVVLESSHALSVEQALHAALLPAAWLAGSVAVVACLVAAGLTFGQTRLLINLSALRPKFSRINPASRLKRIFGPAALIEAARSLAKLGVVAFGASTALIALAPSLPAALGWTTPWLANQMVHTVTRVGVAVLASFALVAGFEVIGSQWQHWRRMRMSRNEVRDEHKEQEGDPFIKRRIRQIQTQRARRRMMAAVPDATVVLTNPTHYAVALAYDRNSGGAPRVVAKGVDEVAARIRSLAETSRVPVVANPPLARALYNVELGAEIPAEHYRLVAEIIAYVWRLRTNVARASLGGAQP